MVTAELGLALLAAEAGLSVAPLVHPALLDRWRKHPQAAERDRRVDVGLPARAPYHCEAPTDGRLLFWGDFHHMKQYVDDVAQLAAQTPEAVMELLLPDGNKVGPTQTFGTTLLFNSAADLRDGSYRKRLVRLLEGSAGSWFRDVPSLALARRLAPEAPTFLGADVALLVPPPEPMGDAHVAVFLGRTSGSHPQLLQLARHLSAQWKLPLEWIPWGDVDAFPSMPDPGALGVRSPAPSADVRRVHGRLTAARCVVTDSYHLALIAWGWKVPALVLAAPHSTDASSVDSGRRWSWRDKREIAASQYDALDLVVRDDELRDPDLLAARLRHVLDVIDDGLLDHVGAAIAHDVRTSRGQLLASWSATSPRPPLVRDLVRSPMPTVTAAAIVGVHHEGTAIVDGAIRSLAAEGVDVVVLLDDVNEATRLAVESWRGRGVVDVQTATTSAVFSLREQLERKALLAATLPHDWVLHVDADEWLHPEGHHAGRLIDLLQRASASGATVVNFEEFTFVPTGHDAPPGDPRESMTLYYFFAPRPERLMRAWRQNHVSPHPAGAGHELVGPEVRVHHEQGVLRHYPVLSPGQGARKYSTRRFAEDELAIGWHGNRVGVAAERFLPPQGPALRRLARWSNRGFDRSCPVPVHFWEAAWPTEQP
jgi:hypothetical protein